MERDAILKKKLHKEDLSKTDLFDILEPFGVSEDTVDNWLTRFGELYDIPLKNLKAGKTYKFKKEWHGLFLILFSTLSKNPMFHRDVAKQNRTLGSMDSYTKELCTAMDTFLSEDDKLELDNHPSHFRAKTQIQLLGNLEKQFSSIISSIQIMPDPLRFEVLAGLNQKMDSWRLHLAKLHSTHLLETNLKKRSYEPEKQLEFELEQSELEEVLLHYLKANMEQTNAKNNAETSPLSEQSDPEADALNMAASLLDEMILGRFRSDTNEKIKKITQEAEEKILCTTDNQKLIETLLEALNDVEDGPKKQIIRSWLENVLKILSVTARPGSRDREYAKKVLQKAVFEEFTLWGDKPKRSDDKLMKPKDKTKTPMPKPIKKP
ncbi:hypothetical protein [Paenibacillus validus]|uniref:hypothetical protein n=1 Tax=Paenibacillus validus TaxID=44253 RepID=UPI003D2E1748